MTKVPVVGGKGVNKDLLPSELEPGVWSDMLNFRSRNGFDEKVEGSVATNGGITGTSSTGAYIVSFQSALGNFAVAGNATKTFALSGTNVGFISGNDISRYVEDQTISTIVRIGANTAEVTTAAPHLLSSFEAVTVAGATEAGYNVVNKSITVTGPSTFRYTTDIAIAANATVVGQYFVVSSASMGTAFTAFPTGGVLNGVLLLNSSTLGLYYWMGTSVSTHLRKVPIIMPSGITCVRPFKYYVVALSGRDVYWSDAADPGSLPTTFTSSATNDAGTNTLAETNGFCVDCLPLGDVNIVYKEDSMYAMQYIGGNSVFQFTRIPGNDGLVARRCIVNTPVGQVFINQNLDIKIHQGGQAKSISDGRVRKWFASHFSNFSSARVPLSLYLVTNPEKNEVWVCFSSVGSTSVADLALVWNWDQDLWSINDLYAIAGSQTFSGASSGVWPTGVSGQDRLVLVNGAGSVRVVDSSATTGVSGLLERKGIDFGDRDTLKYIDGTRANIDGTAGDAWQIYHGASATADGAVTYASPATYTVGTTDYARARGTQGRFGALKITTTATGGAIRSVDLDVKGGAKR